ncbi:MAG: hypothetical protein J6C97_04810 [Clostridia bacterium]|nr:hypothetical protein [Clostridia bacterium]
MEKKEILDQSGVTFKGLFLVFKMIWYWLLAIIIICGASVTLLDMNANKARKYVCSSSVRMVLKDVPYSSLETTYQRLQAYLALPELRSDVSGTDSSGKIVGHWIENNADKNGVDNVDFEYVDQKYYDQGLVNIYGGSTYISASSTEFFTIVFSSYSLTPQQVKVTAYQIAKSLINVLGARWIQADDQSINSASINLVGKVAISVEQNLDDPSGLPARVLAYKPTKAPVIGIVLGMLISAALVLLIYKVDDTIKSKEELERLTGTMFITYIEDIGDIKGGSEQ